MLWRCLMLIAAVALLGGAAAATTHLVPTDFSTIQAAIEASAAHDTVLVAAGVYPENINFHGRSIVVASHYLLTHDPAAIAQTIIDGSTPDHADSASVVLIISGEDSTTVLEGFTLRGGAGTPLRDQSNGLTYVEGGGIMIENASPVIRHNFITQNQALRRGGGITSAGGGGIRAGFGRPQIIGNVILSNAGRYGAGVVINFADATLKNNVIALNTGGQDYGGAGLWLYGPGHTSIADNNTIVGNRSTGTGGGVRVWSTTTHCRNNIVWGNDATSGADQIAGSATQADFRYSDVQGGWTGEGNIDADPLFADSNLTLRPGSPCIDAGDPDPAYNDTNGTRNDMGAYGGPLAVLFPPFVVTLSAPEPEGALPTQMLLGQNYPNPFNAQTVIRFELPKAADVTLEVFDVLGKRVATLAQGPVAAGVHEVTWDAQDVPSGTYVARLKAGEFRAERTMILAK